MLREMDEQTDRQTDSSAIAETDHLHGRIFLKFWGYVGSGTNYQWFNFGGDPTGILDSGSLWNFRYHYVKGGIREPLAKWIWWRHLANNIALAEVPAGSDCFLVVSWKQLHVVAQRLTPNLLFLWRWKNPIMRRVSLNPNQIASKSIKRSSRLQECARRQQADRPWYREMCSNRQNCWHCKRDST